MCGKQALDSRCLLWSTRSCDAARSRIGHVFNFVIKLECTFGVNKKRKNYTDCSLFESLFTCIRISVAWQRVQSGRFVGTGRNKGEIVRMPASLDNFVLRPSYTSAWQRLCKIALQVGYD